MRRKLTLGLSAAVLCAMLSGCWDYKGLDQLTVVAGMYVDILEEDPDQLSVVFEIIDMHSTSNSSEPSSEVMVSSGRTIAEAVYRANKKLHNYMYFGNCEIMVVSERVAKEVGLDRLVDPLLRDHQIRDNLYMLISGEETAEKLIAPPESKDYIISFDMNNSIDPEIRTAHSTRALELYQVYNTLQLDSYSLTLPVIKLSPDDDEEILFDGMAIFEKDRLVDYLGQDDMPYFLLATSRVQGGGYLIELGGESTPVYASLANRNSKPKHRFDFDGEKFTFYIDIQMQTEVSEFSHNWSNLEIAPMKQLEILSGAYLAEKVQQVAVSKKNLGLDIFGFGDLIRNYDYKLWVKVNNNWDEWLREADVIVDCQVKIDNTGLIKTY